MRQRRSRSFALLCAGVAAGCAGPTLHVDNPDRHPAFRDGAALVSQKPMPFRYYGITTIDALPADDAKGKPDWSKLPTRRALEIPAPAPQWLFPLDLPLELLHRALHGNGNQTVAAEVDAAPVRSANAADAAAAELSEISGRAHAARRSR